MPLTAPPVSQPPSMAAGPQCHSQVADGMLPPAGEADVATWCPQQAAAVLVTVF
jgi:hypothetical protein